MPQIKVDSVRVPHPFAGRRQVLLPPLPLDLHVLSLPLAFILSQDQTLHCKWIVRIWLNSLKFLTTYVVNEPPSLKALAVNGKSGVFNLLYFSLSHPGLGDENDHYPKVVSYLLYETSFVLAVVSQSFKELLVWKSKSQTFVVTQGLIPVAGL